MKYKIIILPKLENIKKSTAEFLSAFSKAGGLLICTDGLPPLVNGEPYVWNNEITFTEQFPPSNEFIQSTGGNVISHMRRLEDCEILFLCNIHMDEEAQIQLGTASFEEWFLETGRKAPFSGEAFTLPPACSKLLLCREGKGAVVPLAKSKKTYTLSDWRISANDLNGLIIDTCSVLVNGTVLPEANVIRQDEKLKSIFGIEALNIFSRQPWMLSEAEKSCKFEIEAVYSFDIEEMPAEKMYLGAEHDEIFVNGIKTELCQGFILDKSIRRFDITSCIKRGKNEVLLKTKAFTILNFLEAVYILGNFSLKGSAIVKPKGLKLGDITMQGYRYYSGRITYETHFTIVNKFEKACVTFCDIRAVSSALIVNGRHAGIIPFSPWECDVTEYLHEGDNEIKLIIANSLQNRMGPFEYFEDNRLITPGSFCSEEHKHFAQTGFYGKAVLSLENV